MWMAALPINAGANADKIMMTLRGEVTSLRRQVQAQKQAWARVRAWAWVQMRTPAPRASWRCSCLRKRHR